MLYIVATPIGNLGDISHRALQILNEVDVIACEDTRTSGVLLKHYEINKPLLSFHSHSGSAKVDKIMTYLEKGHKVALISDAGTPGISDPGYRLIDAALQEGIEIIPIPGPTALITALSASGLPADKFTYLGFLPIKKGRQKVLQRIAESDITTIFYESPHRLIKTLAQLDELLGKRQIVVAKELTKIHETFFRGTAKEIAEKFTGKPKGEYVLLISPA